MKHQNCLLVILMCVLLAACSNQQSPLFLDAELETSTGDYFIMSGSNLRLKLRGESSNSTLTKLEVVAMDDKNVSTPVWDTVFAANTTAFSFRVYPKSPEYADSTHVTLWLTLSSADGDYCKSRLEYTSVPADEERIKSTDLLSLYSAASGKQWGFSFLTHNVCFPDQLENDSLSFYDVPQKDSTSTSPSLSWQSKSGLYFAQFNSLDFGSVTPGTLQSAYEMSKHDNTITGLKADDIVLVGTKTKVLGAIKLSLIYDTEGVEDDRYLMTVKYIE